MSEHFTILHEDGDARVGVLKTAHGSIKTPFFMPVATKGVGKFLASSDYELMEAPALIANAFLLSLNPGNEQIKRMGGLHKFMHYPGVLFTDCGGFQMLREDLFIATTDKGIKFKDPYTGKEVLITPKKIMQIEQDIGADVAMMLDDVAAVGSSREATELALTHTHAWAAESLKHHNDRSQLLFGICQGGFFTDLREKSAEYINSLEVEGKKFDGIAIGGVAIGEPQEKSALMVDTCLKFIGKDRPRYVMGVGTPEQLLDYVSKGVDCFDSIFPTKNARHKTLFTRRGNIVIDAGKFREDSKPIDEECDCAVCKKYSRAYLYHLAKLDDPTGKRLCSYHNVHFLVRLMKDCQIAIEEGNFSDFKNDFLKHYLGQKGRKA